MSILLGSVLVLLAATARFFVWPPVTDEPSQTDAVVVFGGEHRDRLETALRLVENGVAPVLVVSDPPDEGGLCSRRERFEVLCLEPSPATTRGDSRAVGRAARARGWTTLTLVTSRYHVTRAKLLLARCFDARVDVVAADPNESLSRTVDRLLHEWGGLVHAYAFDREC